MGLEIRNKAVIKPPMVRPHGIPPRGIDMDTRSRLFEGRFGRIFRALAPADFGSNDTEAEQLLETLAAAMIHEPDCPKDGADDEESGIPSAYTYLGQFIDHDITFDPASSLQQQNDPEALVDFRTPRLDLDSLYGRGPADQPYMYDGNKFRLGRPLFELNHATKVRDLPRFDDTNDPTAAKRALIGDKRNDENVVISQLHSSVLQFHNKLVDANPKAPFEEVQRQVRWHYQWLVVNDFLVTICGPEVVAEILPHNGRNQPIWQNPPKLAFFKWRNNPFMPIEFAAAAYRFGHSMVRPIYRLNTRLNGGDDPAAATPDEVRRGLAGRFFIFAGVQRRGLNGFDAFPQQWAIDWSLYFDIRGSGARVGKNRVQPAYKIDTSLTNPLGFLPEFSKVTTDPPPLTIAQLQAKAIDPVNNPANLAQRNLLRGMAMGLPTGQDVARAMGLEPVKDENLRIGKAVVATLRNPSSKVKQAVDLGRDRPELARSITWSHDERLAALATDSAVAVFPSDAAGRAVRIPLSVVTVQWR